ncbi:MAG: DNA-binding protein [Nanoarchaeota archaeon]
MSTIEEIRKKKLAELQSRILQDDQNLKKQIDEQVKLQEQIQLIESVAKQYLSKEAVSRYGTIKVAHPELALKVAALIAQASQMGQLTEVLSDSEFKEVLKRLQEGKKEFKIVRK